MKFIAILVLLLLCVIGNYNDKRCRSTTAIHR